MIRLHDKVLNIKTVIKYTRNFESLIADYDFFTAVRKCLK